MHRKLVGRAIILFLMTTCYAWALETPTQLLESSLKKVRALNETAENRLEEAYLLYWKARFLAAEEDKDSKKGLLEEALVLADKVRSEQPKSPKALLIWIGIKGELAAFQNPFAALGSLDTLKRAALELKELDEKFDGFAAHRILGMLYHVAPGFVSFGSGKRAREHLKAAMDGAPTFPGNQAYYAEFLLDQGEEAEAKRLAQAALVSPELKNHPFEQTDWVKRATGVLDKLKEKQG